MKKTISKSQKSFIFYAYWKVILSRGGRMHVGSRVPTGGPFIVILSGCGVVSLLILFINTVYGFW